MVMGAGLGRCGPGVKGALQGERGAPFVPEQLECEAHGKATDAIEPGAGRRQPVAREQARYRWCHGGRGIAGHQ
jgi:hypothetical protein